MLSWCWFIGKTINRTRERVYIYIYIYLKQRFVYTVWNHYRLRFKHLLLNKTPRREAGPGSVVRVRTAAPRFFPRLSLSLSLSPHSSPLFLLFLYPSCNERSLSFSSSSFFLSFGLPTAERVESRGFLDTLYLAYFDLPEIHWAVHLVDVRCHVWHAAFQTRRSGSSHIPRWSRPRMKEEGAGGM